MGSGPLRQALREFEGRHGPCGPCGATDAELLACFVRQRDEGAFELLVWRHQRMVLGVCWRVLAHRQDAEDCFQATFLALARKGRSIGKGSVAGWLYRVARRAALRARSAEARHRRRREDA